MTTGTGAGFAKSLSMSSTVCPSAGSKDDLVSFLAGSVGPANATGAGCVSAGATLGEAMASPDAGAGTCTATSGVDPEQPERTRANVMKTANCFTFLPTSMSYISPICGYGR